MKKFFITTPIYYPNDIPHIGHAYTTIAADILTRWHELLGEDTFLLTGTDEHGKKIEKTALKNNKTPKDFVDSLIPKFKEAWKNLNIKYTNFIRTTDEKHVKVVQLLLQKIYENEDIYKGIYEGNYCVDCESYYPDKDLIDNCCPIHKSRVERLKEETYFFKLSKYRDKLLELYEGNKNFILPLSRRNEVINRVKEGIQDLSISRTNFKWGIELPFDKKHIAYVWFDALTNYITGVDYPNEKFKKFWPADVHLVGKDILWFHAVIWPTMLISAGLEPPRTVFAHGWWTFNKEKISKSRGKVISVDELIAIAGVDTARYFLFRETTFGQDGDFSKESLLRRHNTDLANELGNLVNRTLTMVEKYCNNTIPEAEELFSEEHNIKTLAEKLSIDIKTLMENFDFSGTLTKIWELIKLLNQYIDKVAPWKINKTGNTKRLNTIIYTLCEALRIVAVFINPFIPRTSQKILRQLGINPEDFFREQPDILMKWGYLTKEYTVKKEEILFSKVN